MMTNPARSKWRTTRSAVNGGHVFGGVVLSLATLKLEREGNRLGEVARIGGRQLVGVGHCARMGRR